MNVFLLPLALYQQFCYAIDFDQGSRGAQTIKQYYTKVSRIN